MSKYVVTGGAGNVSRPLTKILLKAGNNVTVISRNPDNIAGLVKQGATAAIGDLYDVPFLTETFEGADGVYLMSPTSWDKADLKQITKGLAEGFVKAVKASNVKNVVFLSSFGAHRLEDAGPISGLGLAEVVLNKLDGVNILHLRAGYFYTNLLLSIDLIKTQGIMGNMYTVPDGTFIVVDPEDIAVAAAEALISKNFKGHSFKYVVSDLTGTDEISAVIGKEIGIPDLKWIKLTAADIKSTLLGYGFHDGAANNYVEMGTTLGKGLLFEDFFAGKHKHIGVSIEEYAKKFKAIYNSK
jgi:uncharacterized protein YbjT (DUF2867 family)